ncbi:unnamed protein product [marine sediment metagenome]|uniref:Uncharacterized protein n=1 Tax=marine sediment metagenome TaxID=412755 RepID=X1VU47_9ZZZZ
MSTWKDYHFVSNVFPQTYSVRTRGKLFEELDNIQINSITEYLRWIRGIHPELKFKTIKVHTLGWEIKSREK